MKPIILRMIRDRVPDRQTVERIGCSTSYVHKRRKACGFPAVERKRK